MQCSSKPAISVTRCYCRCGGGDCVVACSALMAVVGSNAVRGGRGAWPQGFLASFADEDPERGAAAGARYALGMLALSIIQTFAGNHGFLVISTLGVKQRAVIMALLYQKSFSLSNAARQVCQLEVTGSHGRPIPD